MNVVIYTVAALLVLSLLLSLKAAFVNRRAQKSGVLFTLLAAGSFFIYYDDRPPFNQVAVRGYLDWLGRLDRVRDANPHFKSAIGPALVVGILLLIRVLVFTRVRVRRRLDRVHDPITNFFGLTSLATLLGALLVSTFSLGWQGALVIAGVFSLVYLGALALLAAIIEITLAISKLISVWIQRRIFRLGTAITRVASFVSNLGGRLVPGRQLESIRQRTSKQESIYQEEQEVQDRKLEAAYARDRDRRKSAQARGQGRPREETPTTTAPTTTAVGSASVPTSSIPTGSQPFESASDTG